MIPYLRLKKFKVCVVNLDDFATQLEMSSLTCKDYFAVERLLQMLIESSIVIAKQLVKLSQKPVRATACENFKILFNLKLIDQLQLDDCKSMIGLRDILMHEYLEIDRDILVSVLKKRLYLNTKKYCEQMLTTL